MKEIYVKGIRQFYLSRAERPPTIMQIDKLDWSVYPIPEFMYKYIIENNDVRAVVTLAAPFSNHGYIHYIYWYLNDTNLDELDRSDFDVVKNNHVFDNTVVLVYQVTRCNDGCKRSFHTLVMTGSTVFTALPKSLNWDPVGKDVHIQNCPNCGSNLRQAVIKIMGELETDI
jgi:hypothetical protein